MLNWFSTSRYSRYNNKKCKTYESNQIRIFKQIFPETFMLCVQAFLLAVSQKPVSENRNLVRKYFERFSLAVKIMANQRSTVSKKPVSQKPEWVYCKPMFPSNKTLQLIILDYYLKLERKWRHRYQRIILSII